MIYDAAERVVAARGATFKNLDGAHIFLTGGTGFFGTWILEVLKHAIDTRRMKGHVTVLSRKPLEFAKKRPHLFHHSAVTWQYGSVADVTIPADVTHVVHAALPKDPAEGILRVLVPDKGRRFLFISSGAVYDYVYEMRTPSGLSSTMQAYSRGKLRAEFICENEALGFKALTIARCFSFIGPYFPLDAHYAISNFVRRGMNGEAPIVYNPAAVRSYMHGADLAGWLLAILAEGRGAYDVGGAEAMSLHTLAKQVSSVLVAPEPVLAETKETGVNDRYVPNVHRAVNELGLKTHFGLTESIEKMAEFYGWRADARR